MKTALITGANGMDGSYLCESLLEKGYHVDGLIRRSSSINTARLDSIYSNPNLALHFGDLADGGSLRKLIEKTQPEEIFHLGAMSHVRVSFDVPEYTADVTGIGTLRMLEAVRDVNSKIRFYQASSSELFGKVQETPQRETTPFYPRSPYGVAKLFAYWTAINYRESYGMFCCNGILFNHEGPRRGETFVTRKITRAIANIKAGTQRYLYLGNLDARRDWGYAKEYVEGMWLMLQQEVPDDYVLATGETHSVREFLQVAFSHVGLDWKDYVRHDSRYDRPAEVDLLLGDARKAKRVLGWEPKTKFDDLVKLMVDADLYEEKL